MKAKTLAGMMAGGALGVALGAGLMMMPQSKQMKKAVQKGASDLKRSVTDWMK